jgi:UDP-N-acetylmuramoyl-L-alanyl-D-glutamate--2,6-diaminopimelate ligase
MVVIDQLLDGVEVVELRGDHARTEVRDVVYDSRRATPGSLFCCIPGEHADGHDHAAAAVAQGAGSLLCEQILDLAVPQVRVRSGSARAAMASMATSFWGHPAQSLEMIGVTGTNGKTTVTQLVRSILDGAGRSTGVIGTLSGIRTTPEAPDLQAQLAEFVDAGTTSVAMEVSSHALVQHRVDGIVFDVAAFTNLSREHLDYHGSMDEYFEAKSLLFTPETCRTGVVMVGTLWGDRLAKFLGQRALPVRRSDADIIEVSMQGTTFRWRGRTVRLPLVGVFNVENALVAAAVGDCLGVDEDAVVAGLEAPVSVPGRMEVVRPGAPVGVVVDYAHTPEGLDVALRASRELAAGGKVICVFGCGGDRDAGKRPLMGRVAADLADLVVVTSDNPRSEDPEAIIDEVLSGMTPGVHLREVDRAVAIRHALEAAQPGDLVLIAGKGHETTQTIGSSRFGFDDRVVADDELERLFGGAAR